MSKLRLDQLLVTLGHAESRSRAQKLIEGGCVFVNGDKVEKSSFSCEETAQISIQGDACPYVSRGGLKLEKALQDFGVDPSGFVCIDSGASTGGFTDCLLQNGAIKVFAIDVGTNQLVDKIRNDPRVVPMEGTNIRYVTQEDLGEAADLSVLDVSFISLKLVLPAVKNLLKADGQVVCLIKPQFEAGREKLGKKGVIKDPATHREVLNSFVSFVQDLGFTIRGLTYSPVKGPEGNIEFLGHLSLSDEGAIYLDTASIVKNAHIALKG